MKKIFKSISNFFGLSFGSSAVLLATGGTCPFCGVPAAACPVGLLSIFTTGTLATIIVYFFIAISKIFRTGLSYITGKKSC